MPIRAIIIMLVVAVVIAACYREQIYEWVKQNTAEKKQEQENTDTKSENEKENQK